MQRRHFIALVGGMAAAWPLGLSAQPLGRMARIGFLGSASATGSAKSVEALRTGLRDLGYVEGRNIVIEFRWAEGKYDRLSDLLAELIRLNVDVIVTHGTPGTRAAKKATSTIPVVMAISGDAIATGLVTSLARPEANVTGSTFFIPQLNAKRLELVKEVCPHVARVAALSNPNNPVSGPIIPAMQAAATPLKLEFDVAEAQGPGEFDSAFASMAKRRVDAVVITEDGEFAASFEAIATLAAANKLASIGAQEYAQAGGLIGYGVNLLGLYRRAAYFVDKILKGAKPADLPIEQPTRFELVINLKTAKTLGLEIAPQCSRVPTKQLNSRAHVRPPPFELNPSRRRPAQVSLFCASRMLLLTRVIGRIYVSYPEWPLTVNLNDGRTACPTVVVHFGRRVGVSARR
jgi:putative ABC transport system substrate-binding protein